MGGVAIPHTPHSAPRPPAAVAGQGWIPAIPVAWLLKRRPDEPLSGRLLAPDGGLAEQLLRLLERVVERLHREVPERRLGQPERLVVPLPIRRVDDARHAIAG